MIWKETIEILNKYSFLDKVERKGVFVYFYYSVGTEKKYKRLALRATPQQIQKVIIDIKNERGVSIYGRAYNADSFIV